MIETREFTTAAQELRPWLQSLGRAERDVADKAMRMLSKAMCALPMPNDDEDEWVVVEEDQRLRQEGWDKCLAQLLSVAQDLTGE